eukprot:6714146-Alexandrium_andersonii.AAC.1
MLDDAHAPHAHSTARGPPGQETPSEVRVDVCAECGPVVLPREAVDAPRAHDQATDQPDERCPIHSGRGRHPPTALLSCKP